MLKAKIVKGEFVGHDSVQAMEDFVKEGKRSNFNSSVWKAL